MGDERRVQPGNAEVEAALIGATLFDPRCLIDLAGRLRGDHFYEPIFGDIFDSIVALQAAGRRPDAKSIARAYDSDERLKDYKGNLFQEIIDNAGLPREAGWYADQIIDFFQRRTALIDIQDAKNRLERATILDDPAADVLGDLVSQVIDVENDAAASTERSLASVAASAVAQIDAAIERRTSGKLAGLSTGIDKLDQMLGGFHPASFNVIAGRTSMGKTALAVQAALALAQAGHRVWFRSFEMSSEDIVKRFLAPLTGVPVDDQSKGNVSELDHLLLREQERVIGQLPLHLDDNPAETIDRLAMKILRAYHKYAPEIVFVDYLQMMRDKPNGKPRYQQIGEAATRLKDLAKQLHIPIVAMAQIGRQVEDRPNKRPMLSDLRESGNIEQDSDTVLMLYRPGYYEPVFLEPPARANEKDADYQNRVADDRKQWEGRRDLAEIIVNKNRQGPTGSAFCYYRAELMKFTEQREDKDDEY